MKKMTAKEFKQVLTDAGMNFEIWGWEGILNIISIHEDRNSNEMREKGLMAGADGCHRRADSIYNVLKARGYYD